MPKPRSMSSPWKTQPDVVVDKVLKRAEVSRMARRLQNRLALAQFKTKHGWEDLTLDNIEPKYEEEIRRKRLSEGDVLSDSSSSASELPYPTRTLMSSPLKAPIFSDAIGSSGGAGHRKRTYITSFDQASSSPSKRFRSSPTAHKSFSGGANGTWHGGHHQLAQSSPIKPRRQQHFTTSTGPDVSFFQGSRRMTDVLTSPNFAAPASDDDDDLLPLHSFAGGNGAGGPDAVAMRSSPPSTPPMRTRGLSGRKAGNKGGNGNKPSTPAGANGGAAKSGVGEEGADLLLFLAASPSPAVPTIRTSRMDPPELSAPSTPPQRASSMALPSSMMTTPGGGNLFPNTPGQGFDFSDFVNITPSPAQKPWKTPGTLGVAKTPLSMARRRLTFEEPLA